MAARLPGLEVRSGGSTSIDITRAGIDKAFGVRQLATHTVLALGVPSVAVEGWEDTAARLQELLPTLSTRV